MDWLSGLRARTRSALRRSVAEREMDEELQFHLDMETEKNLRSGMTLEEARRRARIAFGGVEKHRDSLRDRRGLPVLEQLLLDVRYAMRSFRKNPGFTAAAVVTLELGIGGTTAVFSIMDALFLRAPAGVDRPAEVVKLSVVRDDGDIRTPPTGGPGSYVDYRAMRDGTRAFSGIAAYTGTVDIDLGHGREATQVQGHAASANFFSVLGVQPALGRFFTAEEDSLENTNPVVVISHAFWTRVFGEDPGVIGQTLVLSGKQVTVIGVAE
jgi:hypothetical protein